MNPSLLLVFAFVALAAANVPVRTPEVPTYEREDVTVTKSSTAARIPYSEYALRGYSGYYPYYQSGVEGQYRYPYYNQYSYGYPYYGLNRYYGRQYPYYGYQSQVGSYYPYYRYQQTPYQYQYYPYQYQYYPYQYQYYPYQYQYNYPTVY